MAVMTESRITATDLAERIGSTRAEDIRRTITELIESGTLAPGARLPTIRDVATALETSVGAVADAWGELRRIGLLDTRRRGGTTVAASAHRRAPSLRGGADRDFRRSSGDPAFLPDLADPLLNALQILLAQSPGRAGAELRKVITPRLPFSPEQLLVIPGGHLAMHLAFSALGADGAAVAIEDPTCIWNLRVLRALDRRLLTITSDSQGPCPESVIAALEHSPAVLSFQTAAAVPLGSILTERRRDELAEIIDAVDPPIWIIEENPAGALNVGHSLATALPDRVVHISHLARAYGTPMQIAVVAGPAAAVRAISDLQSSIGANSNPLLEAALTQLLSDPGTDRLVVRAAEVYAQRNTALLSALAERGVTAQGSGGFFAWIPVADERDALLALAERGISATPGSRSMFGSAEPHVRIGTTRLPDDPADVAELADALARSVSHTLAAEDE